jgi:YidC/Oxa1 family membrane protein insertase
MEKRVLIAVVLSLLVLLVWGKYFAPPPPAPAPPAPAPVSAPADPAPGAATPEASPAMGEAAPTLIEVEAVAGVEEREEVLENEHLRLRLNTRGARLTSVALKKYNDYDANPLELAPDFVTDSYPFDEEFPAAPGLQREARTALFAVERQGQELRLVFGNERMRIVRSFALDRAFVQVRMEVSTALATPWSITLGPGLRPLDERESANRFLLPGGLVYWREGKVVRLGPQKVKEPKEVLLGGALYAGMEDNYFASVLFPKTGLDRVRAQVRRDTFRSGTLTRPYRMEMLPEGLRERVRWVPEKRILAVLGPFAPEEESALLAACEGERDPKRLRRILDAVNPQMELRFPVEGPQAVFTAYLGAKDYDFLKRESPPLAALGDLGTFSFIARPLLWSLKGLHSLIPNWGVAIILLTVFLRVLLYPVNHKQMVSMKKMQDVQPKVEAIKRKYKKSAKDMEERNKMNQEVMALYKAEGVNPMGGCLPLLIQIPILWAFYNLLSAAIELRNAPFMLWITDLSAKDPWFVTPILMGGAMFLQQAMTPSTGTDMQKKMFLLMPVIFTWMFLSFPSGLVLYWLVNNILQILQMWVYYRRDRKEAAA